MIVTDYTGLNFCNGAVVMLLTLFLQTKSKSRDDLHSLHP